jgi:glycerophosphoryl diester phosphodiesterase
MSFFQGRAPRLFGHRGSAGTAPENTLAAFEAALTAGADALELDVHATADGELVVLHDATLDRTTSGSGPVGSFTLAEVRALDAGAKFEPAPGEVAYVWDGVPRVPTLAEVLARFPGVPVNIDLKVEGLEELALRVVREARAAEWVLLTSEHDASVERVRRLAPHVATGFSTGEVLAFLQGGDSFAGRALQVPPTFHGHPVITADSVRRAHALGVEVHAWTIDEPHEAETLLALGVDGLISNVPGRLVRVVEAHRRQPL